MELTGRFRTQTYDFGNCFFVDVCVDYWSHTVDAYIFHSQYGVKMFMFGNCLDDISYDEFLDLVDLNFIEYCGLFSKEYIHE